MTVLAIIGMIVLAYGAACIPPFLIMRWLYHSKRVVALAMPRSKFIYYLLSFTWGLPMNVLGAIVALVLTITGCRAEKHGWNYWFRLPINFGLELGIFFLAPKQASEHTKNHEHGHSIQNIYFGPFTIGIVSIPSAIRFWYREIKQKLGGKIKTKYDDAWFEGQATKSGNEFMEREKRED